MLDEFDEDGEDGFARRDRSVPWPRHRDRRSGKMQTEGVCLLHRSAHLSQSTPRSHGEIRENYWKAGLLKEYEDGFLVKCTSAFRKSFFFPRFGDKVMRVALPQHPHAISIIRNNNEYIICLGDFLLLDRLLKSLVSEPSTTHIGRRQRARPVSQGAVSAVRPVLFLSCAGIAAVAASGHRDWRERHSPGFCLGRCSMNEFVWSSSPRPLVHLGQMYHSHLSEWHPTYLMTWKQHLFLGNKEWNTVQTRVGTRRSKRLEAFSLGESLRRGGGARRAQILRASDARFNRWPKGVNLEACLVLMQDQEAPIVAKSPAHARCASPHGLPHPTAATHAAVRLDTPLPCACRALVHSLLLAGVSRTWQARVSWGPHADSDGRLRNEAVAGWQAIDLHANTTRQDLHRSFTSPNTPATAATTTGTLPSAHTRALGLFRPCRFGMVVTLAWWGGGQTHLLRRQSGQSPNLHARRALGTIGWSCLQQNCACI